MSQFLFGMALFGAVVGMAGTLVNPAFGYLVFAGGTCGSILWASLP